MNRCTARRRALHLSPLLVSCAGVLLFALGCAQGPVLDLAELEDHELLMASYQDFLLHEEQDGVVPVSNNLHAVILTPDGEDDPFFIETSDDAREEAPDCYQLPFGTQASLAGTPLELDLGGAQLRPAGPIGFPNETCIRPRADRHAFGADLYELGAMLDITFDSGATRWTVPFENPYGQRRLERIDEGPAIEGGQVSFEWNHENEAPVFRDYRRGGASAGTEVFLDMADREVETWASWEGRRLTIDLPVGVTGLATVYIGYSWSEEDETSYSGGFRGPSLRLDREIEDCPAARCRLEVNPAVAPIELDIQPDLDP